MRTVLFLGLLIISNSIRPESYFEFISINNIAFVFIASFCLDFLEFINACVGSK